MIVLLNGPLGIGKSTLAEALSESIDRCVWLDGDRLVAVNPPPADPLALLHSTLALLIEHYRRFGYLHFIIDYIWTSPTQLADLRERLPGMHEMRCFLLTLPAEENFKRIERRANTRAIDERAFERRTVLEEREMLARGAAELGEPFDVSAPPAELIAEMLARLGLR